MADTTRPDAVSDASPFARRAAAIERTKALGNDGPAEPVISKVLAKLQQAQNRNGT